MASSKLKWSNWRKSCVPGAYRGGYGAWQVGRRQPSAETLKQNIGAAEYEYKVLELGYRSGLPVPRPLYLDEGGEFSTYPFLVMEYIDGRTVFSADSIDDFVAQLAHRLAQVHSADLTNQDVSCLSRIDGENISHKSMSSCLNVQALREKIQLSRLKERNARCFTTWRHSLGALPAMLAMIFLCGVTSTAKLAEAILQRRSSESASTCSLCRRVRGLRHEGMSLIMHNAS